jgi:hypothetical protein
VNQKSLLDVFAPPPGLQGQVAFLVAMSATRSFLEAAMRRFTGLGCDRRAALGIPTAFLALDAHATEGREAILSPLDVPGLIEPQPTWTTARTSSRLRRLPRESSSATTAPVRPQEARSFTLGCTNSSTGAGSSPLRVGRRDSSIRSTSHSSSLSAPRLRGAEGSTS